MAKDDGRAGKDFGWALGKLKKGERVTRGEFGEAGGYFDLQDVPGHGMTILVHPPNMGSYKTNWCPSHSELLGEDWVSDA